MRMVETLFDFVRANRDSDWLLPICRITDGEDLQLSHVWGNFLSQSESKGDLANFSSKYAIQHAHDLLPSGGFKDRTMACSSLGYLTHLSATTRKQIRELFYMLVTHLQKVSIRFLCTQEILMFFAPGLFS